MKVYILVLCIKKKNIKKICRYLNQHNNKKKINQILLRKISLNNN